MPDDLWISGGGTTLVGTDVMFAQAHTIHVLAVSLRAALAAVYSAIELTPGGGCIAPRAGMVASDLHTALAHARDARTQAEQLSRNLDTAMTSYGESEETARQSLERTAAVLGFLAGASFATMLAVLGPLGFAAAWFLPLGVRSSLGTEGETIAAEDMEGDPAQNRALSDPTFVEGLRLAVSSGDEFVLGLGGVPVFLQRLIASSSGAEGVPNTAALLALYGSFGGLFLETPVSVTRTADTFADSGAGFVERIERIPDPAARADGAQLRIDRVSVPGAPDQFEVYIGGTEDFNPVAADTPFDLTSNVVGVAGLPAGSMRAVEQAMRDAGVTAASPVTFTGYSQGGLVAATIASSGEWNTAGLVTIGSPAGHIAVPAGFPAVIIEHAEDTVTALGGVQHNTEAVIVRRQLWASPSDIPVDLAVPGHRLPNYLDTARLLDEAGSPQIVDASAQLDEFRSRGTVTSSYYRAEREQ